MKHFIFSFISIFIGVFLFSSCTTSEHADKIRNKLAANNSYLVDITIEGHTHQFLYYDGSYNHGPAEHWPDCKYCAKEHNGSDYLSIKSNMNSYTDQVIELLKAKDLEIASADEVIKAQEEYMKLSGLIK